MKLKSIINIGFIATLTILFSCGQNASDKSKNVLSLKELTTLADSKSLNEFDDLASKLGYKFIEKFKEDDKTVTQYKLLHKEGTTTYQNVLSYMDFGDDKPTVQLSVPSGLQKSYLDDLKEETTNHDFKKMDDNPVVENGTQYSSYQSDKYFLRLGEKQVDDYWQYNIIILRKP